MSESEIMDILFYGEKPDAVTVWCWEARKTAKESVIARRFGEAYERQKK